MGAAKVEKLRTGTFKHIESELHSYWETLKELKLLKADMMSITMDDENVGGGRNNLPGDPTGRSVVLILTHRKIQQLEMIVNSIRTVYDHLPPEKQKLIHLKYWTKPQTMTWEGIAENLHISERQARRWRDDIVYEIAARLGWR